jgi:hypothetical protein
MVSRTKASSSLTLRMYSMLEKMLAVWMALRKRFFLRGSTHSFPECLVRAQAWLETSEYLRFETI